MPLPGEVYRFIVLTPHADARAEFGRYCRESFSGGGTEFCSFPAAAPVALLDAPASGPALKELAALFRAQSYGNGGGGRMVTGQISELRLPDGKTLAGPRLSVEPPPLPEGLSFVESFPALILAAGIFFGAPALPPLGKPVRFSAAAIANMVLRPLPYKQSYEWTIGEPHWLPSIRRKARP